MLSNIVFIIILILLIIILILLYFFSNDIRKNKNKINICESDINSMRERISTLQQKVLSVENNLNNDFSKKMKMNMDPSFMKNSDGADFAGILETLGGMNNFYQANNNGIFSNNEEDDEEEDDEEEDDDEDDDDEDDDEEDDGEDDDVEDDDGEDDDVEDNEGEKDVVEEEVVVENVIVENVVEEEVVAKSENVVTETPEEIVTSNSKFPKKLLTNLDIGTIDIGSDGTTKYSVQLNKAGRKFWKKI